jgi:UDP-N-acetylmuramate: L-alanyl-gamma-D-glutamyl-meso-diaminopimelate ligase
MVEKGGKLNYFEGDTVLKTIAADQKQIHTESYPTHPYVIRNRITFLKTGKTEIPLRIFGEHNLQNISAAKAVCRCLGVSDDAFYHTIRSFPGAARRLEILAENGRTTVFRDFAHSPSKLLATTSAVKKQFPERMLVACMELHTFSSLNQKFLPLYRQCMKDADLAFVYYNPHTVEHKKLDPISPDMIREGFGKPDLHVTTSSDQLFETLSAIDWKDKNLLLMSSGNFDGKELKELAFRITG